MSNIVKYNVHKSVYKLRKATINGSLTYINT